MKIRVFIISILLGFSSLSYAQFDTKYNSNGDPLTEIIDNNMFKQGKWNYLDQNHSIKRIETFNDDQLLKNEVIISGGSKDISNYSFNYLNNTVLNTSLHGEVIIDENGYILLSFIYFGTSGDTSVISKIEDFIQSNYAQSKSVIFKF